MELPDCEEMSGEASWEELRESVRGFLNPEEEARVEGILQGQLGQAVLGQLQESLEQLQRARFPLHWQATANVMITFLFLLTLIAEHLENGSPEESEENESDMESDSSSEGTVW